MHLTDIFNTDDFQPSPTMPVDPHIDPSRILWNSRNREGLDTQKVLIVNYIYYGCCDVDRMLLLANEIVSDKVVSYEFFIVLTFPYNQTF
jgi:hypothetical protein